MLPKPNRLKKKKDFERVFKIGRSFREGFLLLKVAENDLKESRFGLIISQKVTKKATLRNKLKRRLREILRKKLPEIKKNIDGVFIALPGIEKKAFSELEEIMNKLLEKSGLLK